MDSPIPVQEKLRRYVLVNHPPEILQCFVMPSLQERGVPGRKPRDGLRLSRGITGIRADHRGAQLLSAGKIHNRRMQPGFPNFQHPGVVTIHFCPLNGGAQQLMRLAEPAQMHQRNGLHTERQKIRNSIGSLADFQNAVFGDSERFPVAALQRVKMGIMHFGIDSAGQPVDSLFACCK